MTCEGCKYYIYSAVGIPAVLQWHCRFGFSPFKGFLHTFVPPKLYDCREEARRNAKLIGPVQLSLF